MIILCEPQCYGFEHAAFNAALLATVGAAYPDDEILFCGEPSHLREIEAILSITHAPPLRVTWRPTEISPHKPGGLRLLPAEQKLVQTVLEQAKSTPVRSILFCSATETTVLAIKQILRRTQTAYSVRIVLHGYSARSLNRAGASRGVGDFPCGKRCARRIRPYYNILPYRKVFASMLCAPRQV